MRRTLSILLCFLLLASCLACMGCATLRNLFDHDGGVHVRNEKVELLLYAADGSTSHRYSCRFTGELVDSLPEGEGKLVCKDKGWTYVGGFDSGHLSGQGRLEWDEGTVEEGEFQNDVLVEGTCSYPDGSSYQGTLEKGMYSGQGILIYPDGESYAGSFAEGVFSGEGVYTYSNGDTYQGGWANGLFSGHGVYTTSEGKVYEGEYVEGVFKG